MQSQHFLNPQTRIPVIFTFDLIRSQGSDDYLIRRGIADQLYSRDLFNDQMPLNTDQFFVGRSGLIAETLVGLKQGKNIGLFGLRKTGKTSILFKLRRMAEREGIKVIYFDCKDPAIRNLHWQDLLDRIISSIGTSKKSLPLDRHVSDRFKAVLRSRGSRIHICLIFDEIEYISPLAKKDLHWHQEFVDFWQTLWTAQSEIRNISLLLAGVNPTVVEMDQVAGVQNPVFSIVTPQYVTGLTRPEVGTLLSHIGPWMGLRFDQSAIDYMFDRYGGHPLLTRMVCSNIHLFLTEIMEKRPATITGERLRSTETDREEDIALYSRHVISQLSDFYPVEYEMLEMLAAGNVADYIDLVRGSDYTRHLRGYGLVRDASSSNPSIQIPMIGHFINRERVRRLGEPFGPQIVREDHRPVWLRDRVSRITTDIRTLEKVAAAKGVIELYGRNGFPEAERFNLIGLCSDEASYEHFINISNRCFVEPIEQRGVALKLKDFFWNDIKKIYPHLWYALLRTKLYRHDKMHLVLRQNVEEKLQEILNDDFLRATPQSTGCPFFALQQMVLDGLFVGIQRELERLT